MLELFREELGREPGMTLPRHRGEEPLSLGPDVIVNVLES